MSLPSGPRCGRLGETRSRRSCRLKRTRRRIAAGVYGPNPFPVGASVTFAKPAVPMAAPPLPPPSDALARLVRRGRATDESRLAPYARPAPPPALVTSVARAPAPEAQEPGLGEAAKIESRLGELEAAIKERSNCAVTRADVDKAETVMSDQVSRLAALVNRLTGQVTDLQDQVRTMSAGSEAKLADLTRRVSMSESKSAVAAAERANVSQGRTRPQPQEPGSKGRRRACG